MNKVSELVVQALKEHKSDPFIGCTPEECDACISAYQSSWMVRTYVNLRLRREFRRKHNLDAATVVGIDLEALANFIKEIAPIIIEIILMFI